MAERIGLRGTLVKFEFKPETYSNSDTIAIVLFLCPLIVDSSIPSLIDISKFAHHTKSFTPTLRRSKKVVK